MPRDSTTTANSIPNRCKSELPISVNPADDRLGVFDITDTIQRLCNDALSSTGAVENRNEPLREDQPTPIDSRPELDLLAPDFLKNVATEFFKSTGIAMSIALITRSGRVLQTADHGWRDRFHATCVSSLNRIARENLLQPAPRFSSDILNHIPVPNVPVEGAPFLTKLRGSVCLNELSESLGVPLFAYPIALPHSKGVALFVCDASRVKSDSTHEHFETASRLWLDPCTHVKLIQQLDAWLTVHRCKGYLRTLSLLEWIKSRPRWCLVTALISSSLLLAPVPYYPKRECVFEPETKQFLSSPIQGRMASCEVRPGDRVDSGQLLAKLDDDELRRDLASAQAEYEGAQKKRDSALATRAMGSKGIADVEMQQALWRIESIQDQLKRLEIRANAPGVVVQGDWQRSIGMPLTLGQSLFEVAMLESMTAEVRLNAFDLGHINVGDEVTIRSDASGQTNYSGKINRIEPRATVIDEQAVFIADVVIHDPDSLLRPGMKATAQVKAGWKSLGWILFDKPYRWFANQWIW